MIWLYILTAIVYVIAGGIYASLSYRFSSITQQTAVMGAFIWPVAGFFMLLVALFCIVAAGTDAVTEWAEAKFEERRQ